jgi:hypothetical protein
MKDYNYADDITRDSSYPAASRNNDPKEKIVNEQDEDIILNFEDEKNETDEQLRAFDEGIKNDSIDTEEESTEKPDKKRKS